jgi:hypothetical protein
VRESKGAESKRKKAVPGSTPAKKRGQRTSDIGRALRSVYDETLRENIPDDFMHLLGKLS